MWVQSFYTYWDYFFCLAYGLSWWMFHKHLKILPLLGGTSINVNLVMLVDSFVQIFHIFTDLMSTCSINCWEECKNLGSDCCLFQFRQLLLYVSCSSFSRCCTCMTEKAMVPHSSTLAWKIPWTEEPGGLQSMGSQRVGHDWATSLSLFTFMYWRRKWQPTPVFLPGESHGRQGLVGSRLWGRTESDTTEAT